MVTKVRPQIHMEDTIIEDKELLELLERRQSLKVGATNYRKADKEAKGKVSAMQDKMPFRVGRFIIKKQPVSSRSVSFEVNEGTRISIKLIGDED